MAENYSELGVVELRKLMRERFPVTRGAFAAQATREDCVRVLSGQLIADEAVRQWHQGLAGLPSAVDSSGASREVPPVPTPPEGVAGDNPPPDGKPYASTPPSDAGMEATGRILEAVRTLNPGVAAYFEQLIVAEAERAADEKPTNDLVATDGKVSFVGVEAPVILDMEAQAGTVEAASVPTLDPHFRFEYWNARHQCGPTVFQQKAGDLVKMILADKRIMLVGPPASGKTSVVTQFAAACRWPLTRFNGNRDVTVQDFVGTYEARNGSTVWVDGPLPRAMKGGHILVLDEVDHMPAECTSILHSAMEPGGKLLITSNGGELVSPHKNFRIVGTSNTGGFGDDTGLHPNAKVQDFAFLSRFDCVFRVNWMDERHERKLLIKATGIKEDLAALLVKVARDTRKAAENGDLSYPITLRQTLAWAACSMTCDVATGFAIAVLNKLPEQDVGAVAEIAQRHLGERLGTLTVGPGNEKNEAE